MHYCLGSILLFQCLGKRREEFLGLQFQFIQIPFISTQYR